MSKMKGDQHYKNIFHKSNKDLIEVFNDLHQDYEALKAENIELSGIHHAYSVLKEQNIELNQQLESAIATNTKFGILNLTKLNEEAVFDAINHFNKLCPYCKTDLYSGHIRNVYEIDHFYPIAKGGQDVPWNLLPSCRSCNRKKGDKLPFEYLDESTYNECSTYLKEVLSRITNNHEDKLQRDEITYNLLKDLSSNKLTVQNLIYELNVIFNIKAMSDIEDDNQELNFQEILSKERIDNCTSKTYFAVVDVMRFQEIIDNNLTRKRIKRELIKLYGEPDNSQRFYKIRRKTTNV